MESGKSDTKSQVERHQWPLSSHSAWTSARSTDQTSTNTEPRHMEWRRATIWGKRSGWRWKADDDHTYSDICHLLGRSLVPRKTRVLGRFQVSCSCSARCHNQKYLTNYHNISQLITYVNYQKCRNENCFQTTYTGWLTKKHKIIVLQLLQTVHLNQVNSYISVSYTHLTLPTKRIV